MFDSLSAGNLKSVLTDCTPRALSESDIEQLYMICAAKVTDEHWNESGYTFLVIKDVEGKWISIDDLSLADFIDGAVTTIDFYPKYMELILRNDTFVNTVLIGESEEEDEDYLSDGIFLADDDILEALNNVGIRSALNESLKLSQSGQQAFHQELIDFIKSTIVGEESGNHHIVVTREYISFLDLYDGKQISEDEILDPDFETTVDDICYELTREGFANLWIHDSNFLTLLCEKIEVVSYGKCSKCEFAFKSIISAQGIEFCPECGEKRMESKRTSFESIPKSLSRTVVKQSWKAETWSSNIENIFKESNVGRFFGVHIEESREYEFIEKSLESIKGLVTSDGFWESMPEDSGAADDSVFSLGLCSGCGRDFQPLEKFCINCGNKQLVYEELMNNFL